jgi:protein-disulfide isomerase
MRGSCGSRSKLVLKYTQFERTIQFHLAFAGSSTEKSRMRHSLLYVVLAFSLLAGAQQKTGAHGAKKSPDKTNPSVTADTRTGETKLITKDEANIALQRAFGYDPSQSWEVLFIEPSEVKGISEVFVRLNKKEVVEFFVLPGQKAIKGEMVPFGPNPFAEDRAKLVAADGPFRGPEKAVISVVEFSDLQCPYCKNAQPTIDRLTADFPQVKFIFQNFPMPKHPWAMKGALYAECAAEADHAAFWKFINAVYENQGGIALATADDKLKELATASGLDGQKILACAASPEAQVRVDKSIALGKSVGMQGTPTVYINGRELPGLGGLEYDQLKALMKFEIEHAGR